MKTRFRGFAPSLTCCALAAGIPCAAGAEPAFFFQPRLSIGEDLQAGARTGIGGYRLGGGEVAPFMEVDVRVAGRQVRVRQTPTFSYQYHENRLNAGGGASWAHPLAFGSDAAWQGVMAGGAHYSFGSYRGTARAAESGWHPFAEAALRRDFGALSGEIGVRYAPQPHLVPFRLMLGLMWSVP